MRVVIADDEPLARSRLARLCRQCSDLYISAEAASGAETIHAIQEYRPDLVLLDVELQDMNAFDVLAALDGVAPITIMVDRARHRHPQILAAGGFGQIAALHASLDGQARTARSRTRFLAEKLQRLHFIEPDLIDCIEADGNYVVVHIETERYIARSTIKHLAVKLAPLGFLRIERSLLINLSRVAFIEKLGGSCYAFTLLGGRRLISSVAYHKEIQKEIRYAQLAGP
jgi:two-component system LytT family response regulator